MYQRTVPLLAQCLAIIIVVFQCVTVSASDDIVKAAIEDVCKKLLQGREQSELTSRWNDYKALLDAAKSKKFYSSDLSMAAIDPALGGHSWMVPNPAMHSDPRFAISNKLWELEPISFTDHLENLKLMKTLVQNPDWGLFGPHSQFWKVVGFSGDLLNVGAMSLLQLAHPVVAQGLYDHSRIFSDPIERMRQTAKYTYKIIYEPWADLEKISVGIFKGHSHVRGVMPESIAGYALGQPYQALSPEALLWVYATRLMTWIDAYELLAPNPLDNFEREQVYQESKLFALAFGVPLKALPRTFFDFYKYYQYMIGSDRLAVGQIAHTLLNQMESMSEKFMTSVIGAELIMGAWAIGPTLITMGAVKRGNENMSSYFLTPKLSRQFGYVFSTAERNLNTRLTLKIIEGLHQRGLTVLPAYEIAQARITGTRVSSGVLRRHFLITGEQR